ncbi:FAD-binding oxidoreductase [Roseibium denhamense]|uniref:D-amino-acid dehydrogenase n=1 Tax=Roseibium denhamense TaxID=76305 RepID=A0ABY1PFB3_9HYPH|nr:FAD-binding oxidoreductase [Roseibium denhamense]MTI06264.1 FAD-binding oxidoreductase [Roseibium denhamense]SMP32933.1 D-amino-acid dehydrogenase [Roseibium denhamense]
MTQSQEGPHKEDVAIVGGGVLGICSALALQEAGRKVVIIDRAEDGLKTSEGNAGAFAFTEVMPLAAPGIMLKAPKWLLDPLGPLAVPPSYALKIAPWMLRFWRASWPDRYRASIQHQAELMRLTQTALEDLIKTVGGEELMCREGQLQLFEGRRSFEADLPARKAKTEHGIRFEVLESHGAIADIQPGLSDQFTHAVFTPDWMNTIDPAAWLRHLTGIFLSRGGGFIEEEVQKLAPGEDGIALQCKGKRVLARQVVVCAGAWSHQLAKTIGDTIPLETERGYNTTLPQGAFDIRTHLTFSDHGFVASRNKGGVRIGGAVELGGLKLPPNYKRSKALLEKAKSFLPGLEAEGGTEWMGYRPSLPDSLPVISRASADPRVIYAFGHGHLGLTQSAGTGRLVAELAQDRAPSIDLKPLSGTRF